MYFVSLRGNNIPRCAGTRVHGYRFAARNNRSIASSSWFLISHARLSGCRAIVREPVIRRLHHDRSISTDRSNSVSTNRKYTSCVSLGIRSFATRWRDYYLILTERCGFKSYLSSLCNRDHVTHSEGIYCWNILSREINLVSLLDISFNVRLILRD